MNTLVKCCVFGFGLGIADSKLKVEVDERVEHVTGMLPGYNCGRTGKIFQGARMERPDQRIPSHPDAGRPSDHP